MQLQSIPRTGISVSPICLGTMTFGNPVDRDNAIRLVHAALDNGINFIDTADMYEGYDRYLGSPGGVSEIFLGEALRDRRDQAIITTKVGSVVGGSDYKGQGLGREHILHQIDLSLERLQTDHVEFYLMHRPDPDTPLADSIAVFAELIEAGKVRHWGFSNFTADQVRQVVRICDEQGWPRPVISQPPFSWLNRDEEKDHFPACREFDIAITPYQPLQGGLLTGKYKRGQPLPSASRATESSWLSEPDEETYNQLERFESEARSAGRSPAQHAVDWVLEQRGVVSVVVGTKRIQQLESLIG